MWGFFFERNNSNKLIIPLYSDKTTKRVMKFNIINASVCYCSWKMNAFIDISHKTYIVNRSRNLLYKLGERN